MLDIMTMRIALGTVSILVTVLFFMGVYRPTRSTFAGWWTVGLLCSGGSTSLLMLNGTSAQVVTNPAANVLSVLGTTCVWFATRSLRGGGLPQWLMPVAAAAIVAVSALDQPATNAWAGNGVLFAYMAVMFVLGSVELWRSWRSRRVSEGPVRSTEALVALLVAALAASVLAVFYSLRTVLFLTVGKDSGLFETLVGTGTTTAILLLTLVAVTFSASTIGWDQQTRVLRRRAVSDDLTGLLGRSEFLTWTDTALSQSSPGVSLVVADLDHFKRINDEHGHAAGDTALLAFADALRDVVGEGEFAGRLGGEEFALLLRDAPERATSRLESLAHALAQRSRTADVPLPTASFGIAAATQGDTLTALFERADQAMYQAKAEGRDRVVVYAEPAL
ncbi:GGDEF domain-containing protein [Demequina activiva]|uniref:GGDEF domain-containing protein n=1 Tax=Demequina activiva TaxID=1582364 RepID=A0A919Q2Q4_9MICO|nr:GGDEF domain-containing protein [Demequina activiva]GIG54524.1 hypothetical protein Dac01nite_12760 [Demequina activiva]